MMPLRRHIVRRFTWPVIALALSGCVSQAGSLPRPDGSLAADLCEPAEPRLARLQVQDADERTSVLLAQAAPPTALPPSDPPSSVAPGSPSASTHRIMVRAWVNSQPIFESDVINLILRDLLELQAVPEPQRSEKATVLREKALNHLIDQELLYQDAVYKLEKNNPKALDKLRDTARTEFEKNMRRRLEQQKMSFEELKTQLRKQGLSLEVLQKREERRFIAEEYMRSRILPNIFRIVNHAMIREYFDQHRNEFQKLDSVKWQDVFLAVGTRHATLAQAKQFAESLAARGRTTEDFVKLMEFDDGDSKLRGGWGQGERRGEINPPQVEEILFQMKEGQIQFVDLDTGVHIVRLVKREHAGALPFDEKIQTMIRNKLRNELAQREQQRVLNDLRSRAIIEIVPYNP
jgi:parvulin-like peptidyl-prolyl isomerase